MEIALHGTARKKRVDRRPVGGVLEAAGHPATPFQVPVDQHQRNAVRIGAPDDELSAGDRTYQRHRQDGGC